MVVFPLYLRRQQLLFYRVLDACPSGEWTKQTPLSATKLKLSCLMLCCQNRAYSSRHRQKKTFWRYIGVSDTSRSFNSCNLNFGISNLNSLSRLSTPFWRIGQGCLVLLKEGHLVLSGTVDSCQSEARMSSRNQGFPAERCRVIRWLRWCRTCQFYWPMTFAKHLSADVLLGWKWCVCNRPLNASDWHECVYIGGTLKSAVAHPDDEGYLTCTNETQKEVTKGWSPILSHAC